MKVIRQPYWMPKRSIKIGGHNTSISLEAEFWDEFRGIARRRGILLKELVSEIEAEREANGIRNLSSAIRLYVLRDVQERAQEAAAVRDAALELYNEFKELLGEKINGLELKYSDRINLASLAMAKSTGRFDA